MKSILLLTLILAVGCLADSDDVLSSGYKSKIRKLASMLGSSYKLVDGVKVTAPLRTDDLSILVDKFFPDADSNQACLESQQCAKNWMGDYNFLFQKLTEKRIYVEFAVLTNSSVSDSADDRVEDFPQLRNRFEVTTRKTAKLFLKNCKNWDAGLKRMIYLIARGNSINRSEDLKNLNKMLEEMSDIRRDAKACGVRGEDKCLPIDSDLKQLFKTSRDQTKLLLAWKALHDSIRASNMREDFKKIVDILTKSAVESGYKDYGQVWLEDYEEKKMEIIIDKLFGEIKPLYDQLHKYVLRKLSKFYRDDSADRGLLKVHLLGDIMGKNWENIFDIVKPYPDAKTYNLDQALKDKSYTPRGIFKEAERFFASIGLFRMNETFWKFSVLEKPNDRSVECFATSYDFMNGFDYRTKMCTNLTEDNFIAAHHEMGHIEYAISYRNLYPVFRAGANSAFHEAIGETIARSVVTPKHLKRIGLIDDDETSREQDINFLMKVALRKLAFLPFAYTVDKWRNEVFRGTFTDKDYNSKWWLLRERYQGVEAPLERNESNFDPGSFFHIAAFIPYNRYFVGTLLEFQFYEAMCRLSDHSGPLHKCDFYESRRAGEKLKEMMALGTKRHWTYALNVLTGEKQIKIGPLVEYFKPLTAWLLKENSK